MPKLLNFTNKIDKNDHMQATAAVDKSQLAINICNPANQQQQQPTNCNQKQTTTLNGLNEVQQRHRYRDFKIEWNDLNYVVKSNWFELTKTRRQILCSLSGSFKSGELTAILGPSGAGKSTLVDCLVGKALIENLTGSTKVSFVEDQFLNNATTIATTQDKVSTSTQSPLRVSIIPQDDYLFGSLTVSETLMFASKIKNAHLTSFDNAKNVARVIKLLNLTQCADLQCSNLSGGQYKRVSIAQELLSSPDILILDEPTSGLDAITCFQVVSALKDLALNSKHPLAIVATIHQPDVEVLELFDKAYVLANGGRAIFEGPVCNIFSTIRQAVRDVKSFIGVDDLKDCDNTLQVLQKLEPIADEARGNPARFIVELAAGEFGFSMISALSSIQQQSSLQLQQQQTIKHNNQRTAENNDNCSQNSRSSNISTNTSSNKHSSNTLNSLDTTTNSSATIVSSPVFDYNKFEPSKRSAKLDPLLCLGASSRNTNTNLSVLARHICVHSKRSWLTIVRDPILCSVQIALHILVPLLISYCFQQHDIDACPLIEPLNLIEEAYSNSSLIDELNVEMRLAIEAQGYFFIQLYVIIFAAICGYALTYPLSMKVLVKEYRNGWYSVGSYFVGQTLADLPICACNVVLAVAISYYLTGQARSTYEWRFASLASLTVLATLVAQTQGLIFGALLMNSPQSTVFAAPASTAPLVIISGFLLRLRSLPVPLQIASKLSYFTYLMQGAVISRYGFNRCDCDEQTFGMISSQNKTIEQSFPKAARDWIDIWVDSYKTDFVDSNRNNNNTIETPNLSGKLLSALEKARMFGFEMKTCAQVKPFAMLDYNLNDFDLPVCFAALVFMLIGFRILAYITLRWQLNKSL